MVNLPTNRPLNILAIDGGAMMGVIPARILQYLEGNTKNTYAYSNGYNPASSTPPKPNSSISVTSIDEQVFSAFDIIVGTSTGGLLTLGLTVPPGVKGTGENSLPTNPMTAEALLNFYFSQGPNIFPSTTYNMMDTPSPLFNNEGLINAITSVYGAPTQNNSQIITSSNNVKPTNAASTLRTLSDAVTPALVTSYNYNMSQTATPTGQVTANINDSTPQGPLLLGNVGTPTLDNWGNPLSVIQGALMTSAFPLLLPPVPVDLDFYGQATASPPTSINYFLDGGIFAGSPALAAWMWALSNGYQVGTLVSIGCGSHSVPTDVPNTYNPVATWGAGSSELIYSTLSSIASSTTSVPLSAAISALLKILPTFYGRKIGWMESEPFSDGSFSALMTLMSSGAGQFSDLMMSTIIGNQSFTNTSTGDKVPGRFYRLQPELGVSTGTPAWSSTNSILTGWVQSTDDWILNNSSVSSSISSISGQISAISAL